MFTIKKTILIVGLLIAGFSVVQCNGDDNGAGDSGPDAVVFDPNDIDGDGIPNDQDSDMDGDGIPNTEDSDMDGDGVNNNGDNCEAWVNPDQTDEDDDGFGDPCDNCPEIANPGQQDADDDDIGDHCDTKLDLPPLDGIITCAEQQSESSPIPANLYYLTDWSGSMWCDVNLNDPCMSGDCWQSSAGCTTPRKDVWDDAVDAIAPMMTSGTFNLGVGGFSGADCDNLPDPFLNMTTSADLQLTPSLFTNAAKFGAGDPTGTTPTGAALAGVLEDDLYNLADDAETRRSKAVVLVTDGEPTSCPADDTEAEQNAVVQAKALAEAGIPVYVLGFAGVRDDIMDAISYAGSIQYHANVQGTGDSTGTPQCTLPDQDDCWCADTSPAGCWSISDYGQAQTGRRLWYEVNDTQAIVDALEEIAWSTTTCILPLGESCVADFEISAVKLIGAGECTDSPSADCYVPESASNGYQIDYQPTEDPSADGGVGCDEGTARIYGSWCRYLIEKVQADPEVAVEARIGCQCSGVEICADGVDNDCDGQTDEGCDIIIE